MVGTETWKWLDVAEGRIVIVAVGWVRSRGTGGSVDAGRLYKV